MHVFGRESPILTIGREKASFFYSSLYSNNGCPFAEPFVILCDQAIPNLKQYVVVLIMSTYTLLVHPVRMRKL